MNNETRLRQDIENISSMPIPDIGVATPIHLMEACSLAMQLANVACPLDRATPHPQSFTPHTPGVISLKTKDTATTDLKAVEGSRKASSQLLD